MLNPKYRAQSRFRRDQQIMVRQDSPVFAGMLGIVIYNGSPYYVVVDFGEAGIVIFEDEHLAPVRFKLKR